MIVNPSDMTATVKTSIRIPEDAFPTITRVPGAMINFRYYVEVVVDLRGKVTTPERFLPRFNMTSGGSTFSPSGQILNPADANGSGISANWAGNILDTDQVRRSKGVVSVAFEVVVGTRDSQRKTSAIERTLSATAESTASNFPLDSSTFPNAETEDWPEASPNDYGYDEEYFPEQEWPENPEEYSVPYQPNGPMVPHPELEEPEDEKARIRRHEETLLPSQPPDEDEAGPSTGDINVPTAPVLPDDHHLQAYEHVPSSADAMPFAVRSAESLQTVVVNGDSFEPSGPSAPHEDKQELERQRLIEQASAPREPPSEENDAAGPSAPVFDEDDQLVGGTAHADESLPRYQR